MRNLRVLFMAKETISSVAAMKYLLEKNVSIVYAVTRPEDNTLSELCKKNKIRTGSEEDFLIQYRSIDVDYLFSFYWKLVKKETLQIPKKGCINFHPGPLPEARGSGYHVAILNDWGYWGVTAHFMDETFDTGDIIDCRRFPIPQDIINCELVQLAHIELTKLFKFILDDILHNKALDRKPQGEGGYYSKNDIEIGKVICDSDTNEDVEKKIRAYWNPPYMGAKIMINGEYYTVVNKKILNYISAHTKSTFASSMDK